MTGNAIIWTNECQLVKYCWERYRMSVSMKCFLFYNAYWFGKLFAIFYPYARRANHLAFNWCDVEFNLHLALLMYIHVCVLKMDAYLLILDSYAVNSFNRFALYFLFMFFLFGSSSPSTTVAGLPANPPLSRLVAYVGVIACLKGAAKTATFETFSSCQGMNSKLTWVLQ